MSYKVFLFLSMTPYPILRYLESFVSNASDLLVFVRILNGTLTITLMDQQFLEQILHGSYLALMLPNNKKYP